MNSYTRYLLIRAVAAPGLAALVLVLALPAAHADVTRTGAEPWYQQAPVDARQRAQALFAQAIDKHAQLLLGNAIDFYEQALQLWDNPDIRWNLALALEDQKQYLRAHQELESALRWEAALGAERLRDVQDRMRALETQYLARIEADSQEAGADITLDGQPWFRGAERRSTLVLPGTHYIASIKPGYTQTIVSVSVAAGKQYRATLRMTPDRPIETRRWSAWKPWAAVAAGVTVAAVGAGLESQAFENRDAAAKALASPCKVVIGCEPTLNSYGHSANYFYSRARMENHFAIGAFATGGTAIAIGLALTWLNQPRAHGPEALPSSIELIPTVSRERAELSALIRF